MSFRAWLEFIESNRNRLLALAGEYCALDSESSGSIDSGRLLRLVEQQIRMDPVAVAWRESPCTDAIDKLLYQVVYYEHVRKHEFSLISYARRLLRSSEDAREVVQETIISAMESQLISFKSGRYDSLVPLKTYLFTILTQKCNNRLRLMNRRRTHTMVIHGRNVVEEREKEYPDNAPTPDILASQAELYQALKQAIRECSHLKGYRVADLVLQGLSHEEIGKILGINPGASRRALNHFRECLKNKLPTNFDSYLIEN